MFERMKDYILDIIDGHEGIIMVLLVIGMIILSLGLVFGGYLLTGWILMFIYNAIKPMFNLPDLSYWVFVGGAFVISLLRPSVIVKNKGD